MRPVLASTAAVRSLHHSRNYPQQMTICRCMFFELTFKCFCGRQRTNTIHQRKLGKLATGWSIEGSTITPTISTAPVAPKELLDVVSCSCTTEGKACSGTRCSCNKAGLSCTDYCKCEGGVTCCSPFTIKQMDNEDNEGELSVEDDDEEELEITDSW